MILKYKIFLTYKIKCVDVGIDNQDSDMELENIINQEFPKIVLPSDSQHNLRSIASKIPLTETVNKMLVIILSRFVPFFNQWNLISNSTSMDFDKILGNNNANTKTKNNNSNTKKEDQQIQPKITNKDDAKIFLFSKMAATKNNSESLITIILRNIKELQSLFLCLLELSKINFLVSRGFIDSQYGIEQKFLTMDSFAFDASLHPKLVDSTMENISIQKIFSRYYEKLSEIYIMKQKITICFFIVQILKLITDTNNGQLQNGELFFNAFKNNIFSHWINLTSQPNTAKANNKSNENEEDADNQSQKNNQNQKNSQQNPQIQKDPLMILVASNEYLLCTQFIISQNSLETKIKEAASILKLLFQLFQEFLLCGISSKIKKSFSLFGCNMAQNNFLASLEFNVNSIFNHLNYLINIENEKNQKQQNNKNQTPQNNKNQKQPNAEKIILHFKQMLDLLKMSKDKQSQFGQIKNEILKLVPSIQNPEIQIRQISLDVLNPFLAKFVSYLNNDQEIDTLYKNIREFTGNVSHLQPYIFQNMEEQKQEDFLRKHLVVDLVWCAVMEIYGRFLSNNSLVSIRTIENTKIAIDFRQNIINEYKHMVASLNALFSVFCYGNFDVHLYLKICNFLISEYINTSIVVMSILLRHMRSKNHNIKQRITNKQAGDNSTLNNEIMDLVKLISNFCKLLYGLHLQHCDIINGTDYVDSIVIPLYKYPKPAQQTQTSTAQQTQTSTAQQTQPPTVQNLSAQQTQNVSQAQTSQVMPLSQPPTVQNLSAQQTQTSTAQNLSAQQTQPSTVQNSSAQQTQTSTAQQTQTSTAQQTQTSTAQNLSAQQTQTSTAQNLSAQQTQPPTVQNLSAQQTQTSTAQQTQTALLKQQNIPLAQPNTQNINQQTIKSIINKDDFYRFKYLISKKELSKNKVNPINLEMTLGFIEYIQNGSFLIGNNLRKYTPLCLSKISSLYKTDFNILSVCVDNNKNPLYNVPSLKTKNSLAFLTSVENALYFIILLFLSVLEFTAISISFNHLNLVMKSNYSNILSIFQNFFGNLDLNDIFVVLQENISKILNLIKDNSNLLKHYTHGTTMANINKTSSSYIATVLTTLGELSNLLKKTSKVYQQSKMVPQAVYSSNEIISENFFRASQLLSSKENGTKLSSQEENEAKQIKTNANNTFGLNMRVPNFNKINEIFDSANKFKINIGENGKSPFNLLARATLANQGTTILLKGDKGKKTINTAIAPVKYVKAARPTSKKSVAAAMATTVGVTTTAVVLGENNNQNDQNNPLETKNL